MPFIKRQSSERFTVVPNSILESNALDLKDIGMLCFILHLPPTWNFSVEGLDSILKNNGRASIMSSLKSLEKAGYLVRFQNRNNGAFREAVWVVSDTPMTSNDLLDVATSLNDSPQACFPSSENRTTGNRTQINTNRNNTLDISTTKDIKNNKHIKSPKENKTKEINTNADFDVFWSAYPKKVGKKDARKAFQKIEGKVPLETLLSAIEAQKKTIQWQKDNGQYIPNPSSWLNRERWEDVVGPAGQSTTRRSNPFLDMLRKEEGQYEQEADIADAGDPTGGVPLPLQGHEQR